MCLPSPKDSKNKPQSKSHIRAYMNWALWPGNNRINYSNILHVRPKKKKLKTKLKGRLTIQLQTDPPSRNQVTVVVIVHNSLYPSHPPFPPIIPLGYQTGKVHAIFPNNVGRRLKSCTSKHGHTCMLMLKGAVHEGLAPFLTNTVLSLW